MKLRLLYTFWIVAFVSTAECQSLFWTEVGGAKVDTSGFNGTSQATVLSGLSSPYGIAFDQGSGRIFWTDVTGGKIYASDRNGAEPTIFASGLSLPRGIAINNSNGTIYWVENGSKKIRSTPVSGGSITDILTTGLVAPTGIAVDAKHGKIYWTDNGGTDKYIGMCGLDGSNITHIESMTALVSGIAVDTVHSQIYWTEYGTQKRIMSAALDGSDTATVLTLTSSDPRGIIVMGSAGLIYWTNYLTNTVESANLDGMNATTVINGGLNNPLSLFTTSDGLLVAAFQQYPGTALYFDGSTNYVNVGTSSTFNFSGSFTVEAWIKVVSFPHPNWDAIITKGDDSWRIARSNSSNVLAFSTNGLSNVDMGGTTNVNDGNWHFFAAVYDGSTKTLYVDGHVDVSVSVTGTLSSSTYPVYFGENAGHTGRNFNGYIDEVRVWSIARTESQVRADMFTTVSSAQPSLLGYWQFNDGSGTTVIEPVSGNSGSISGTPNWMTSTAPVGEYGAYDASSSTDSAGPSGSTIRATLFSTPDSLDFVGIYAYGSPATTATAIESLPGGVTKRSDLVWGVYGFGIDTVSLTMEYGGLSGISDQNTLHLLSRSEADAPWSDLTGSFFHNTSQEIFSSTSTPFDAANPSAQYSIGGGSDNSLAVGAISLAAKADVDAVDLSWLTKSEIDNAGFNVLRENAPQTGQPQTTSFRIISSYTSNDSLRGLGTSSIGRAYDFVDNQVIPGSTYTYKVQSVSTNGTTKDLNTVSVTVGVPKTYALYQNYPNPFNPSTTIRFDLKEQSTVTLEIYNVLGQRVLEKNYGTVNAGRFNEVVNMDRFASSVYYYRINVVGNDGQKFVSVKKLVLVK